jgi:predicted double-glycine peptidase
VAESITWFVLLMLVTLALAWLGQRAAQLPGRGAGVVGIAGLLTLMVLSYLGHHAALMLHVLPLHVVQYLEGTVGLPVLGLVLALAWSKSTCLRQRVVVGAGTAVAVLVFLYSSAWMILPAPRATFSQEVATLDTRQSTEYSCVAAASAIALGQLGLPTSEDQMAQLTRTRPMTGASVIRAAWALNHRLQGAGVDARVIRGNWQTLAHLPMPALCTLQFDRRRVHMVTVLEVRENYALIVDPNDGQIWFPRGAFEMHSDGAIIALLPQPGALVHAQLAQSQWPMAAHLSMGH